MSGQAPDPRVATIGTPLSTPQDGAGRNERRRLVAAALQVGNPPNQARVLPDEADPLGECQIELDVEEIRPYEHNPRRATNAKFTEIKESIRAGGIRNPLTVTRRPGETHFVVEAGGNTRLAAIQELWAQTRDPRFRRLSVLFRPWRSESHVLTSHLVENEQRGELTFWDKAAGIVALKGSLEAEQGQGLSLRQLDAALKSAGLSVNTATLAHCLFANERLGILGENVRELSGLDVKVLQPRLNALRRYAESRISLPEDEIYARIFEPAFQHVAQRYAQTGCFSAAAVCEACDEALARALAEPVDELRRACRLTAGSPQDRSESDIPRIVDPAASAADAGGFPVSTANAAASEGVNEQQAGAPATNHVDFEASSNEIVDRVRAFAVRAQIADCVERDDAAPFGFRLRWLVDLDADPLRRRAWGLLAGISGVQPPHPPQRVPEAGILDWLTDPTDEAAEMFWQLLLLVRAARRGRRGRPLAAQPAMGSVEA